MNEWERQRRKAEYLKKAYPPGTRIVLNSMGNEPRPMPDKNNTNHGLTAYF